MLDFFNSDCISLKICGITQASTAQALIELGVDALGFNFWPQSKRYLEPQQAQTWLPKIQHLSPHPTKQPIIKIGLFVNQSLAQIQELYQQGFFDYAQLHGEETPSFTKELISLGIPCIKALRIKDEQDIPLVTEFSHTGISALLLDAYHPQEQGGSGHSFDWELISHPSIQQTAIPIILAGGINTSNISKAAQVPGIVALDLASGAESSPGKQDLEKVSLLLNKLTTSIRN